MIIGLTHRLVTFVLSGCPSVTMACLLAIKPKPEKLCVYTGIGPCGVTALWMLSFCFKLDGVVAANVTCVEPPPKSRAATVLTGSLLSFSEKKSQYNSTRRKTTIYWLAIQWMANLEKAIRE